MIRRTAVFALCIVSLAAAAVLLPMSSWAGTKKIWMDSFKLGEQDQSLSADWWQDPSQLNHTATADASTIWSGVANVKPPVGKRITAVTYYHRGWAGSPTSMSLRRVKLGQIREELFKGGSSVNTTPENPVQEVTLTMEPGADTVVRRGYRYFLIGTADVSTGLNGVKITYR